MPDQNIEPGGCRVIAQQGEIDQQIETQLARIISELTSGNED
jgi:flagellar biosynthesis/type III secretory pathway protein FliH